MAHTASTTINQVRLTRELRKRVAHAQVETGESLNEIVERALLALLKDAEAEALSAAIEPASQEVVDEVDNLLAKSGVELGGVNPFVGGKKKVTR